jgi:hypothetical protein
MDMPDHAHMCILPPGYFRPSEREDWFPKWILAYYDGVVSKYVREARDDEWTIAWRKPGELNQYKT